MPDTGRKAQLAALIEADLSAEPLPRARLDLLWLGPTFLPALSAMAAGSYTNTQFFGEGSEATAVFEACVKALQAGSITSTDIEWAMRVDEIAGTAENKFRQGDAAAAIDTFREALGAAPGCDNYMMSMSICYYELGMPREALRYLERAHEINPGSPRIARKLAELRETMGTPAREDDSATAEASAVANTPAGWVRFDHLEGLFSLAHPSHWREVSAVSDGAALSCQTSDGNLLFEVLCFERAGFPSTDFAKVLADGMATYGIREEGMKRGRVLAHSLVPLGSGEQGRHLVIAYRDPVDRDISVHYLFLASGSHAVYLALKTLTPLLEKHLPNFERLIGTLKTPWLTVTHAPTLSRGSSGGSRALWTVVLIAVGIGLALWLLR